MKHCGRYLGVMGCAAAMLGGPAWAAATAGTVPAGAKSAPRAAASDAGPAVTDGSRSMGADELARAGRQVVGTPATTIYQATLQDGTFELSDRPPPGGATGVGSRSYAVPQDAAARQRAESERDYWRRQAEAFDRRRAERDRALEQAQRARPAPPSTVVVQTDWRRGVYHGYGWAPTDLFGVPVAGPGTVIAGGFSPSYTSSPGAVQGRDGGFIGSGFGTRR